MKLTDLTLIFLLIVVPLMIVSNFKIAEEESVLLQQYKVKKYLNVAIEDSFNNIIEKNENDDYIINKDLLINQFFNSLYVNFQVIDQPIIQEKIKSYIPMVILLQEDGFYMYGIFESANEIKYIWYPKTIYVKETKNYIYRFNMTSTINVYDKNSGEFYDQEFHKIKGIKEELMLTSYEEFKDYKNDLIASKITQVAQQQIDRHNNVAKSFGVNYTFDASPNDLNKMIKESQSNSIIVLFQGLPIGRKRINIYATGHSSLRKNKFYFGLKSENSERNVYHREKCNEVDLSKPYEVFSDRKNAAQRGFFPCLECNP